MPDQKLSRTLLRVTMRRNPASKSPSPRQTLKLITANRTRNRGSGRLLNLLAALLPARRSSTPRCISTVLQALVQSQQLAPCHPSLKLENELLLATCCALLHVACPLSGPLWQRWKAQMAFSEDVLRLNLRLHSNASHSNRAQFPNCKIGGCEYLFNRDMV